MTNNKTCAAIAADSPLTTSAGVRIAQLGGNAVDIAVAASLTATLAEILMCSLGGSAFMMIHRPEQGTEVIDGADAMPDLRRHVNLSPEYRLVHLPYGDGIDIRVGHGSVAVPGMLAALELAWRRHGTLPWSEIVAPALELAKNGFPLGVTTARWLELAGRLIFNQQPASRACFFPKGDRIPTPGDWFHVPDMEQTLEAIAQEGACAFYQGDIAHAFAQEMADHGGLVTRSDLANYRAQVRHPLMLKSQGFTLALNPPPAVGGVAVGSLIRLLELGWQSGATEAEWAFQQAQAQAYLFGLRENQMNASDFDTQAARVLLEKATLQNHLSALRSPHTTHISVATNSGELVAITLSSGYGSGITIPQTGITCNNSLGEPELNPQGYLAAQPGSRIISNMAPTIAWHPQGTRVALGTPGASRITTAIAQTWVRYAWQGTSLETAVVAPRLHVEPERDGWRVLCEPGIDTTLLPSDFIVHQFEQPDMFFGAIKLTALDQNGKLQAVADLRRQGAIEIVD